MIHCRRVLLAAIGSASFIGGFCPVSLSQNVFSTSLTGASERPVPADSTGSGVGSVVVVPEQGYLCFSLYATGIAPAKAAHIHKGTVKEAGAVVVPLAAPTNGSAKGCVDADRSLLQDIAANPKSYYINVHNANFPNGVMRGQLAK